VPETVSEAIKSKMEGMSPTYRKIALFLLENMFNLGFVSVNEMGRILGVSNATVVRFSQMLGFSGYKEMRECVSREIRSRSADEKQVALSKLDELPVTLQVSELFGNEIANIKDCQERIKAETLGQVVKHIEEAEKLFVAGFGASADVAHLFSRQLIPLTKRPVMFLGGSVSDYMVRLNQLTERDYVMLLTLPSYSPEGWQIVNYAKQQKAKVCLFTDSPSCPMYPMSDDVVFFGRKSVLSLNSFVGFVAVAQVLKNLLLVQQKGVKMQDLEKVLEEEGNGYQFIKNHIS
jgi:DNA-binding MurR/RpiR family transcriptional regulator